MLESLSYSAFDYVNACLRINCEYSFMFACQECQQVEREDLPCILVFCNASVERKTFTSQYSRLPVMWPLSQAVFHYETAKSLALGLTF